LTKRPTALWTNATRSYWSKDEQQRIPNYPFWQTVPQYARAASVLRTMEDSRVDPIMVTMADNYSTQGNVLTVADYAGASISNYRFGDVVYPDPSSGFCTQAGACPTYTYLGEFAGKLALPFKPTSVHSSNVP
jgi:hypothetical protein